MRRPTLRRKLLTWLIGYLGLLTLVVFGAANYVHEHAEHAVWRALLNSELDSILSHSHSDPDYRWQDSDNMRLYRESDVDGLPGVLRELHPGLHDGPFVQGRDSALMVRETSTMGKVVLALDITDFAELESFITRLSILAGIAMVIVTLLMAWVGMSRLVRPLTKLAGSISALRPEQNGQRIEVDARGSNELEVIAQSLNDYLDRTERFVQRERVFISTASHELRTPIAVITGAAELALEQADMSPRARQQLQRIRSTAGSVEQLIQLLLILAREPSRLAALNERLALEQLLTEIIDDHRHLTAGKELRVVLTPTPGCDILAPMGVVQAAIGNLLRNAIENSDRGTIQVQLSAAAVVTIDDPGHGMSPEEIAAVYAQIARGERSARSGIGLELIARLCEHLGWKLDIQSNQQAGTRVTLDMSASLPR